MKILAPLAKFEEVTPLALAGADQFYCGLLDTKEALNDRPNTGEYNFPDISELSKAVKMAHRLGKTIYLVINNPTPTLKRAMAQAKIAGHLGIDGLILSNNLLIKRIKGMNLKMNLGGSCLLAVCNSWSVKFAQDLGLKTLHLPRQLGINDVKRIADNASGMELSVFGMMGMCVNIEAYCFLHYLKEDYFIPCKHFKVKKIIGHGKVSKEEMNKKITMPRFSCAMCALKKLKDIGVASVKIEGRGAPLHEKIRNVSALKQALQATQNYRQDKDYQACCKKIFKKYFNEPCKPEYCYF